MRDEAWVRNFLMAGGPAEYSGMPLADKRRSAPPQPSRPLSRPPSMVGALALAFGQLGDPAARRVVWLGILGALAGFAGLAVLAGYALDRAHLVEPGWLQTGLDWLGGLAVIALAWLLFPAVAIGISSLLLDEVVDAVERRHYPTLAPKRHQPWGEVILGALRFFTIVPGLNLLVLPLYFFPAVNLAVFYVLNGYLLSREYFEAVALRRLDPATARILRKANGLRLFSAGVIIAFLSTIPFVNLLIPVVATAFMVHIFHALTRDTPQVDAETLRRSGRW